MGAGIFTANTTLKVSAAVSASGSSSGGSTGNVYGASASSYAVVQAFLTSISATNATLAIDGRTVAILTAAMTTAPIQLYIGPSKILTVTASGGLANATCVVSGVEFANSP